MSAETIIVTATTIAVRALVDGIAALREGAKADERAEIERLLAQLHASAPQPVASSLDAITETHLARVRAKVSPADLAPVEGDYLAPVPARGERVALRAADAWEHGVVTNLMVVNGQLLVSASGVSADGTVIGPHVSAFWGDRVRAISDLPVEGQDPDQ